MEREYRVLCKECLEELGRGTFNDSPIRNELFYTLYYYLTSDPRDPEHEIPIMCSKDHLLPDGDFHLVEIDGNLYKASMDYEESRVDLVAIEPLN